MNSQLHYTVDVRRLEEFSAVDLYALLRLRVDVFVVEQACAYPELDGDDLNALHLRFLQDGLPIACARIFQPSPSAHPRIGRVAVSKDHRGEGLGAALMAEALSTCELAFPSQPIEISAQSYLLAFYTSLGFRPISEEYVEDGLPHIDMLRGVQ
ncbi:GNAT family N-acetyltransferase [Rhizobium helianthi]|uniref:GNAT family N-acetyltransferase n=1 Tax=Rhizobium helianthi TaxID=1132695 RepID=A0ABW4LYZ1_9HYPH